MNKRFLKFKYAAIRRYGEKRWTASNGVSSFEKGEFGTENDIPYIVELSNGTKFLCFLHSYGKGAEDEILSDHGEVANSYAADTCYDKVKKNMNKLNGYDYGNK